MEKLSFHLVDVLNKRFQLVQDQLPGDDTATCICRYSALSTLDKDVDELRKQIYTIHHRDHSTEYDELDSRLHVLDQNIQDSRFEAQYVIDKSYKEKTAEEDHNKDETSKTIKSKQNDGSVQGESITSLRKRLLSVKSGQSELDAVQSTQVKNQHYESLQQALLDSLPSVVNDVKEQAVQFQDMLKEDAVILKEATENFEKSHGKFGVVNEMLMKYHKEGKLGLFFYIRVIAMVLIAFLMLVILIRLIPERH